MRTLPLLAGLVLGSSVLAQVQPGQSLVGVGVATTSGEMYLVDHGARKSTKMTIPPALMSGIPNAITMVNPVLGYVGTAGTAGTVPGDVYRITIAGTTVTAVKLNTTALQGYNVAQIAIAGGNLYFNSSDHVSSTAGWDGYLYEMPISGGAPQQIVDLKTLPSWPTNTTCNALCTDGKKVFFSTWPGGDLYEYDIAAKTTTKIATLPASKYPSTTFYPVNLHMLPGSNGTQLYAIGLYGDVLVWDIPKKSVAQHYFSKAPALTNGSLYKNSGYYDPDTGDFVIGTRDGHVDIFSTAGGGQASHRDIGGVGSDPTPSSNSCAAIYYNPAGGGTAWHYGPGCAGSGSFVPTSVVRGALNRGSTNFAFGVGDGLGGAPALLFIGGQKLRVDLGALGAPGCLLLQDLMLAIPVALTGTGDGMGSFHAPIALPNAGLTFTSQWAILDASANTLGIVMTDGREVKIP